MAALVETPLIVLVGATASGKTALTLRLAEEFGGEIVSCDSVAVYRGMEIGTAKPTLEERTRVPHHLLDVAWPNEPCTAGDYSRLARLALVEITARGRVPIVAGGTGLYLRALLDGLFAAPSERKGLRERLRRTAEARGAAYLHRLLRRFDPEAAARIHANDLSKVVRAIEVSFAARQPLTEQWKKGRDKLTDYSVLRLGLAPARERLYERINARAAAMFAQGLVQETQGLVVRYGWDCRPLTSLGYAEATAVLRGECTREQAIARAQQGHRNYAKRQGTWFRRESEMHWLAGCGEDESVGKQASALVAAHLVPRASAEV